MADIKSGKDAKEASSEVSATRSGMNSPYFDLEASIKVAEIIHNKGGGACAPDQLAAWLEYKSTRSGTYLTRVSAANKHFGLIDTDGDRFIVTERAQKILAPVMPNDAVEAKADAFLAVPLFAKVYERFRGTQLPPEIGLKNLFENTFKVLPDRVPQAVRVFLSSAEQAGFFATTGDRSRLVRPAAANVPPQGVVTKKDEQLPAPEKPKGGGGDGPTGGVHSAIIGLLRELPPPGTPWTSQKKQRFLDAFKATVDFIYPEEDSQ